MEINHYSLEVNKSNKLTRIFQLVFGILCAVIALVWLFMNLDTLKLNKGFLVTIIFLLGFAWFQVNSGLGKGEKFIEIGQEALKLKKNSMFPAREINASDILKIEIFPLSMIFFLRSGKKVLMRFGTTYTDMIVPVKNSIATFCTANNITMEYKNEEL